jgi:hypothetical protein
MVNIFFSCFMCSHHHIIQAAPEALNFRYHKWTTSIQHDVVQVYVLLELELEIYIKVHTYEEPLINGEL